MIATLQHIFGMIITQAKPNQAATMKATISCNLKSPYEQAGLLWYFDDDNYIKFVKELIDDKPSVVLVREEQAKPDVIAVVAISADPVDLKLSIVDNTITAQYRTVEDTDGHTLAEASSFALQELKCGLFTHGGDEASPRRA